MNSVFDDPEDCLINLIDIVDPKRQRKKEQEEEYRIPLRLRHFQNIIVILGREQDDLLSKRVEIMKKGEKLQKENEILQNDLFAVIERLQYVERRLNEAYREIDKEKQNL
jgi:hypothetical protein